MARNVASSSSLLSVPILNQPFVIGPGFSSIPAKTVGQILAGKLVDLSDLLSANISQVEPEGRLAQRALSVYSLDQKAASSGGGYCDVVRSLHDLFQDHGLLFPHRWQDLTQYKLLILQTYRQFNGRV